MCSVVSDNAGQITKLDDPHGTDVALQEGNIGSSSLQKMMVVAGTLVAKDAERRFREDRQLSQLQMDPHLEEGLRQKAFEISQLDREPGSPVVETAQKNGQFFFHTSDDMMMVCIDIEPPCGGGEPVIHANVLDRLRSLGILRGIILEALDDAISKANAGGTVQKQLIVKGRLPQKTTHERLLFHLRKYTGEEPFTVDDSAVFDTPAHWFCQQHDVIAEIIPGHRGENGYDIKGKELSAEQVKTIQLKAGNSVRMEHGRFIATTSGLVCCGRGKLEVRKLLVFRKDITCADGLVEFDGEILVRGSVRDGARIIATDNITVDGLVEAAEIRSRAGSIVLRHGVTGRHRGRIIAADSIVTRFAENAMLQAEQDVTIEKAAVHSHLIAGRSIICVRDRGQILGGIALAGKSIELKCAGGQLGVVTDLVVGLSKDSMHSLGRIERLLRAYQIQQTEVDQTVEKIRRAVGDPQKLPVAQRKIFGLLLRKQLRLNLRLQRLNQRRFNIHRNPDDGMAEVIVHKQVMERVNIRIGDCVHKNTDIVGPSRFTYSTSKACIERRDL